jgi:hypothetical protein
MPQNSQHFHLICVLQKNTNTYIHTVVKYVAYKISTCFFFNFHGATARMGPGPLHYRGFTITLRHTRLSRTPLDE